METEGESGLVTYRPRLPSVVVFTRTGTARLGEGETFLLLALSVGVGMDGNGFTVAVDFALSVLELVIELKRELSFLVIITPSNAPSLLNQGSGRV